ncbi:MAG: hypothetical protein M1832_002353 [Thelocarpon impressellum]|nr:MAG: hypothetical protein M1832_002353 [Thelocarpon impressellum]
MSNTVRSYFGRKASISEPVPLCMKNRPSRWNIRSHFTSKSADTAPMFVDMFDTCPTCHGYSRHASAESARSRTADDVVFRSIGPRPSMTNSTLAKLRRGGSKILSFFARSKSNHQPVSMSEQHWLEDELAAAMAQDVALDPTRVTTEVPEAPARNTAPKRSSGGTPERSCLVPADRPRRDRSGKGRSVSWSDDIQSDINDSEVHEAAISLPQEPPKALVAEDVTVPVMAQEVPTPSTQDLASPSEIAPVEQCSGSWTISLAFRPKPPVAKTPDAPRIPLLTDIPTLPMAELPEIPRTQDLADRPTPPLAEARDVPDTTDLPNRPTPPVAEATDVSWTQGIPDRPMPPPKMRRRIYLASRTKHRSAPMENRPTYWFRGYPRPNRILSRAPALQISQDLVYHPKPRVIKDPEAPAASEPSPPPKAVLAQSPGEGTVAISPKEHILGFNPADRSGLRGPGGIRTTKSNPGFTRMLSHKLSQKLSEVFFYQTIVHRPDLNSRHSINLMLTETWPMFLNLPSLEAFAKVDAAPLRLPGGSPDDTTDPSSYNTSGNRSSPRDGNRANSTESTSLTSDVPARRSCGHKRGKLPALNKARSLSVLRELGNDSFMGLNEPSQVVMPTILTVETTATAKIFFETHFNRILSNAVSPRSQRRRDFEHRLHTERMTTEQRNRERRDWSRCESEHLRQVRVMSGRPTDKRGQAGVAVAGYEVVKILGKGSFGVVRLVREREDDGFISASEPSSPSKLAGRRDLQSGSSTLDSFKTTLTSRRPSWKRTGSGRQRQVFAMKVIRKSEMLRNTQEGHLRAERDFLVASEGSRWIVPLVASFQDKTNLYLVMEYMVGGDFLGLLIRKHMLTEEVTRWYVAEMILCIEEAHALKWIHRDVKPDNFLISASGHLKISDFGLAFDGEWAHDQAYFNNHRHSLLERLGIAVAGDATDRAEAGIESRSASGHNRHEVPADVQAAGSLKGGILNWRNSSGNRNMAKSIVGTSQYMAPEVIRGELYDGRCDWWSVGIIMYECLFGYTPFCMENRQETKLKILHHPMSLTFPSDVKVSHKAVDLIENILREKEIRLCSKKYSVNDFKLSPREQGQLLAIRADKTAPGYHGRYVYADDAGDLKKHPFFRGINWERQHESRPPFVPKVKNVEDTRYFDEDEAVSDVDDASSYSSALEHLGQPDEDGEVFHDARELSAERSEKLRVAEKAPRRVEKRRARDKILRDGGVGKHALELRKLGAFKGYTYRRPSAPMGRKEGDRRRVNRPLYSLSPPVV